MNMETRYRIVGRTNSWIASRDANFKGKTEVVFKDDLSLKDAKNELLRMYNYDYGTFWNNWGMAIIQSKGNAWTASDGMRAYEFDSRTYKIEEYEIN